MKAALLHAICESPEDDLPRLAYADWLEEQGEKYTLRAELVRVQIELARAGAEDLPHHPELRRREAELLADHRAEWAREELPPGIALAEGLPGRGFRRGFAAEPWCPLNALLARGEELARLPVETLRLVEFTQARTPELAACPALAHFRRLNLASNPYPLGDTGIAALLESPHLAELDELTLPGLPRDTPGVVWAHRLAGCERLRRLTSLGASSCRLGTSGLRQVLNSPHLRQLTKLAVGANRLDDTAAHLLSQHEPAWEWKALHVGNNRFSQAGVRAILENPYLHNLETLGLNNLDAGVVEAIRQAGLPPSLRRLSLLRSRLDSVSASALAGNEDLAGLEELTLSDNELTGAAAALAGSPHLASLRCLALYQARLDGPAVEALASSAYLRLRSVSLWENPFGAAGMRALANSPVLGGIVSLDLSETELREEGALALAGAAWLSRLHALELDRDDVGDAGVEALAASPGVAGLVRLGLRANSVRDRGACAVADSPYLGRLRRLDLSSNGVGDEGAFALARSPHLHPRLTLVLSRGGITGAGESALRDRFGDRLRL